MENVKEEIQLKVKENVIWTPIVIWKRPTDKKGAQLAALVDQAAGGKVPVKLVICKEKSMGRWAVAMDEDSKENEVGYIKSGLDDDAKARDLILNKNYGIEVTGREGNAFKAALLEMPTDKKVAKADDALSDDCKNAEKRIVEKGLDTQEDLDRKVRYMRENNVTDQMICLVFRKYRKYNKSAHQARVLYQDPYLADLPEGSESLIAEGLQKALQRSPIICEGDKSVGKNVYVETIAWLMGMPLYMITLSRQMSPSAIYGEKTTDNSAMQRLKDFDPQILEEAKRVHEKIQYGLNMARLAKAKSDVAVQWVYNSLSDEDRAILKKESEYEKLCAQTASVNIIVDQSELFDWMTDGGIMVFNEMNLAEANFLTSFVNPLTDGTGFLVFPGRGEVKENPDCVLFATQNADYQGTEDQNDAAMSRFGCLQFHQPKSVKRQLAAAVEAELKRSYDPSVKLPSAKYYLQCQSFYTECMHSVNNGTISNMCLNIRGMVRAIKTAALDSHTTLKRQLEIEVVSTCPVDDQMALKAALDQYITL